MRVRVAVPVFMPATAAAVPGRLRRIRGIWRLRRKARAAQRRFHVRQRLLFGVHRQRARAQPERQPPHARHTGQRMANFAFFSGAIHVGNAPGHFGQGRACGVHAAD